MRLNEHTDDKVLSDLIKEYNRTRDYGMKDMILCKIENYIKEKEENEQQDKDVLL